MLPTDIRPGAVALLSGAFRARGEASKRIGGGGVDERSTEADRHGDYIRFSRAIAPACGAAVLRGTDFVRIEAGRLQSVMGFLDEVPAAA